MFRNLVQKSFFAKVVSEDALTVVFRKLFRKCLERVFRPFFSRKLFVLSNVFFSNVEFSNVFSKVLFTESSFLFFVCFDFVRCFRKLFSGNVFPKVGRKFFESFYRQCIVEFGLRQSFLKVFFRTSFFESVRLKVFSRVLFYFRSLLFRNLRFDIFFRF